ncbi:SDR family NAD(P)-dependent oxidoreductase [Actinotalea fermentans]|uniref:Short-chain dehydrogenase n=1 Tax=Actinotalea fermentans TaxID=43671 RepID=A0A511YWD5_9CELL|nr:SDR family NAD(P)-dependent oxidoreductase [Actinotalea fermentans]KGM16402.1 short-chain dehydrogenase [Actinotalea fermentans ATCC 43279 = JCM 9966 = DSM 3133]GEN79521.1 short-chain dehydrogenase [Actinotalea fermentans]
MKVAGKTVAVTGGGNGIGRELVLALLARGARVAALDLSADGLAGTVELARAAGLAGQGTLSTHVVDITDRTAVEALPEAVTAAHGQVDGVINCAGIIQPFVRFADLGYDQIERVMNVNFWGLAYVTKTFLPHLVRRPAAHIVNVSSMGGFLPVPGQTVYGASKAAVKLLTEGLHSELVGTPVSVTVVFPGATGTNITGNSGVATPDMTPEQQAEAAKKHKPLAPAQAARIIVDAMERDAYRVTVGKDATMLDRFARLSPRRAAALIQRNMASLLG